MKNVDAEWEKVQQGDESSFDILYHHFYPGLFRYAEYLLNDHSLAEETVHDVLINVWKMSQTIYSKGDSLKNYLYRATHNESINILKSKKSLKNKIFCLLPPETWEIFSEKYSSDENISEKIEAEETAALIEKVIEEMAPQCREIFRLSRYEYKTNKEIAEQMDLSENTIRVQLHRAMKKIEKILLNV